MARHKALWKLGLHDLISLGNRTPLESELMPPLSVAEFFVCLFLNTGNLNAQVLLLLWAFMKNRVAGLIEKPVLGPSAG